MRNTIPALLVFLALVLAGAGTAFADGGEEVVLYRGGLWWNGEYFERRDYHSASGVLRAEYGGTPDRTVDLAGRYVIPPYGEAHGPGLAAGSSLEERIRRLLADGIFYVQNPRALPGAREKLADAVNAPGRLDATFSHGGLTGPGGYPTSLWERQHRRGYWGEAEGDGGLFHQIENLPDLEATWPRLVESEPDFVTVYLLYSEEHEARSADPALGDWHGLDPRLLPQVVRRAREAGLRVACHVESAADFRIAVFSGVDQILHLPGYRVPLGEPPPLDRFLLTPEDAERAAEKGIAVVSTIGETVHMDPAVDFNRYRSRADSIHKHNLRVLRDAGVKLAFGSGLEHRTARLELEYIGRLGVFSPAEILEVWCRNTAEAIFPDRKIGRLAEGYEASFLVLKGNPQENLLQLKQIETRVKQGRTIPLDTNEQAAK